MQSFIAQTIHAIAKENQHFNDIILVLPSQRAKVFVRQALLNEIDLGFFPKIFSIEEFVGEVSGIQKTDSISLLFYFYSIYKQQESDPDSFDIFTSWAIKVLQDFNEIDQHLVNAKDIFVYIRDIQRLRKWSVKGTFQETKLIKDHHKFLEKLNLYYNLLYSFLLKKNIGYQGILYREAVNNLSNYLQKQHLKKFYFIGFNALNAAEEYIIQQMLLEGNTNIFWDIDRLFLESSHQAGSFMRKYRSNWKYYEKNEFKTVSNWFSEEKKIEIIGASQNVTQLKNVGVLLSKIQNTNQTALVLADETLLPVALSSLPKNIDDVNVTMGYPLKDIPATQLVFSIFQLFFSQTKLQKTQDNLFYYKDIVRFLRQSLISRFLHKNYQFVTQKFFNVLSVQNSTFLTGDFIIQFFESKERPVSFFSLVFLPFISVKEFSERILSLISILKDDASTLEKEFLYRYELIFKQIENFQKQFGFITDLKTLFFFFKQFISSENLSFQGNPLQGLQVMGMLETRVIDFEKIIITSVNEGIIPANSNQSSFIPFDVKVDFNLPTYREKDAIFSYHFFRLLQRAKEVYIFYNTETDSFGKGEKSRFVKQLELLNENILEKFVSLNVTTEKSVLRNVMKNQDVMFKLQELAQKGISPSTISTYLHNPLVFYKQKVLKIKEVNDVEETVAMNTMGSVVHDTLEELYKPFVGKFIKVDAITSMESQVKNLVEKYFKKYFANGDLTTGKNRLIYEVAIRFVTNFLTQEKILLADTNNQLKIIATEEQLSANIKLDQLNYPIKIHGKVDRIDQLNGVIRVIDYKTGMVNELDLKIPFLNEINDYKYHKSIQVLMYAYMFLSQKENSDVKELEAGIISFKNLRKGFLKLNFAEGRKKDHQVTLDRIEEFTEAFKDILSEIYTQNIPFTEPLDLAF